MANVYLVLLTYANSVESHRASYARITLTSALENLKTSHVLKVHLADDGSDPKHITELQEICKSYKVDYSMTNASRGGYGASYNLATQHCHYDAEYLLMLEDDWQLKHSLELDPLIKSLDDGKDNSDYLGCIRLGYLGWTQELRGRILKYGDMSYLRFDSDTSEPHVWAGHPRLETVEFQRRMGPWTEGIDPGSTEFEVAHRESARDGVGWPLDAGVNASQYYATLFCHIGSVQARSDQEVKSA
jgi:hypothetical protein